MSITDLSRFSAHLADCVILTKDGKVLLQYRPPGYGYFQDRFNIFGGHVEEGESILNALMRELEEELGAKVRLEETVFVGAVSEEMTQHKELVHIHFWHDKHGTITGCYEAEAREFASVAEVLALSNLMDYARWAFLECINKGLLTCP